MPEDVTKPDPRAVTLSNAEIGSPESRAAARSLLDCPAGPPVIDIQYVSKESVLEKREDDVSRAKYGEREWIREPSEAVGEFRARVLNELPAFRPYAISWWTK